MDESAKNEVAPVPLLQLAAGGCGLVVDVISAEGESAQLKRLGLCAGRTVQLMQQGDPLIVRVLGSRLGLSSRLAETVLVRPVNDVATRTE